MRWDRTAWLSALFYAVAGAIVATLTLRNEAEQWRYEYARSTDAAGEYLFICAPILCALVALNARRVAAVTQHFATGSPNPRAGAYRTWIRFAAWAGVVHALVLGGAMIVCWRSSALPITTVSFEPFVRQFALITLACAAGAFLGAWIPSVVLPAVIFALMLFVTLLIPATHVRPFLLAGSGTFDFTFQQYPRSLMILAVLTAISAALATCFVTRRGRLILWALRGMAIVGVVASVALMTTDGPFRLQWVAQQQACLQQTPGVCGPLHAINAVSEFGAIAQTIYRDVPSQVSSQFPKQLVVVAPGTPQEPANAIEFDTRDYGQYQALAYQAIRTLSGANLCVDTIKDRDVESQVVGAAVVLGWIEQRVHIDLPGSYPPDLVTRLLAMPTTQQTQTVSQLISQVRACNGVDLTKLQ